VRILVFSESTNLEYIDDAFSHGVAGYVVKSATFNELHVAVQRLFVGQTYRSLPFDEGQLRR
jgi:DNA-binding NarL/FixJ family response regulator